MASASTGTRRRVALVMPVRNEEAAVDETMAAVFASTRLPDEIIVADALSTDGTVGRLKSWADRGVPLRIVPNPTLYCGGGRNAAIRATDCDVILIVDFGNPVFPEYIEEMTRPFEESADVDLTMGILIPLMRTPFEHCMGVIYYDENIALGELSPSQRQALLPEVLLPGGGCIGMTRRFWEDMGGYPEWLARSQDRLFSLKAWCRGARTVVAWDARCYNHVRRDAWGVYRMAFGWARCNGQSRYLRRHLLKALPFHGLVAGLLAASAWYPASMLGALALLVGYTGKAGVRRLLRVDGRIERPVYLWHCFTILVAGDLGTIAGQAVGWAEWFVRREYRQRFWDYLRGVPPSRLHVLER